MKYQSTRNKNTEVTASEAILRGISEDGGLFVPKEFPRFSVDDIKALSGLPYGKRACYVLGAFLTDFEFDDIQECTEKAYSANFENCEPAPIVRLGEGKYIMELWHGPTCAFKDLALQILPHLLVKSKKNTGDDSSVLILTATSGDTGKAALEGFKNVDKTEIIVFYPEFGVSNIQKLQMKTQQGNNVSVCGVTDNFDCTQSFVKSIFTDEDVRSELGKYGKRFSSANSINLGRLLPQVAYYVSAYCSLVAEGEIECGDEINVTVPTGNFGNILSAYYARKMGIPIKTLVCASNRNNILTDFIETGVYDTNRNFFVTESPSMDILISSNLERLLFDMSGENDSLVSELMESLRSEGKYIVCDDMLRKIRSVFSSGYCGDETGRETIKNLFEEYSYLCDTHTAVAVTVANEYLRKTGDNTKMLIVSTASPYKFPRAVYRAVSGEDEADDFAAAEKLESLTGNRMPEQLSKLREAEVRFNNVVSRDEMRDFVLTRGRGEN